MLSGTSFERAQTVGQPFGADMQPVPFYTLKLDVCSQEEALQAIDSTLKAKRSGTLCFLNAHSFNVSRSDPLYHDVLLRSDLLLNDGVGISIAARLAGIRLPENLNGTDFIPRLIAHAKELGKRIYLLGGKPGVAEMAKKRLEERISEVAIVGTHCGYFDEVEEESIVGEIVDRKVDVLIVGMGVPRQELWLAHVAGRLPEGTLTVAGGAILDFISGGVKRAPLWLRRCDLEWLYRLWLEPRRMWQRYLIGNIVFLYHVLRLRRNRKTELMMCKKRAPDGLPERLPSGERTSVR